VCARPPWRRKTCALIAYTMSRLTFSFDFKVEERHFERFVSIFVYYWISVHDYSPLFLLSCSICAKTMLATVLCGRVENLLYRYTVLFMYTLNNKVYGWLALTVLSG
jgi:hypothetical protein